MGICVFMHVEDGWLRAFSFQMCYATLWHYEQQFEHMQLAGFTGLSLLALSCVDWLGWCVYTDKMLIWYSDVLGN